MAPNRNLADAAIASVNRQALLIREAPLVVLQFYVGLRLEGPPQQEAMRARSSVHRGGAMAGVLVVAQNVVVRFGSGRFVRQRAIRLELQAPITQFSSATS